ncbi:sirohydrochlorin chelatase [Nocardia sp. alder85J]|uniref:sirohydrochlorin chelatase n=1 Tax=Nocardia sp. alder85J TaxID=2862949 RepID=UPI001CD62A4C|nr:sirohydrochlorin chelatase [Nocardia sp. alder85J]MCX4097532.1 sirohydrochlorin chelatase [Nocardia sp. alder85J]
MSPLRRGGGEGRDPIGPGRPALVVVAHGSRDPRSAATVSEVVSAVAAARPELDVYPAFLDLNAPSVERAVDAVAAAGHTAAVAVPLLLGSAFHARVDLPGLLAAARTRHPFLHCTQADVLGADPRLVTALRDRVRATGADPRDPRVGVAVAAVGSSSPAANDRTRRLARPLVAGTAWRAEVCFATTEPTLPETISRLRARGCQRVVIAPWFLAPGRLTDRLHGAAGPHPFAAPLGAHPALVDVVLERYTNAVSLPLPLSA